MQAKNLNYVTSTKEKESFGFHQGAQVPQKHSSRLFKAFLFVSLGLLTSQLFIHSAYAASYVDVSSNGDGTSGSGVVRLGKISPSSTGTQATGSDTLTIHTDCAAGYKVYVSSQENQSTSLVNSNAATPENPSAKDLITAASNTLAEGVSPSTLSSNTWGINGNSTEAGNGLYYGLPSFENSTAFPLITMSNVAEESTVPIYYGVKVDTSINPGTYSGSVLYTVLINNSCLDYTVVFNPNVNSSSTSEITGTMSDQSIMYGETTALSQNAYTRAGYNFLGWSTSSTGKTGTVVNGIGTAADVDYADEASVLNLVSGGGIVTLYAIWEEIIPTRISEMTTMQQMNSAICANSSIGENKVVTDVRDNSTYRINKLKDGNCWMVENLRITNKVLDSTTSDLADGTTFTVPASTKQAFTESFSGVTPRMALSDNTSYGGYYNFTAATAGTGNGYNQGTTSGTYSICPKGWTLPTKDNFVSLDKAFGYSGENRTGGTAQWNASYANTNYPAGYPGMALAGRYYSDYPNLYSGQSAAYWSSTTASTTHAYYLDFGTGSTYLYPQNQVSKFLGASVRCIVKPDTMQNLNCNTINTGTTVTLKDTRDEQDYTVYRFPNAGTAGTNYPTSMAGYCLMTKDLSLGYVTGGSTTAGGNLSLTTDTSAAAGTITARPNGSGWSSTNSDDNLQYMNGPQSGQETYSSHSYYSYGAAQKVCPKGWRLPTKAEYDNIATFMGGNNSTDSSEIRSAPYNFVYGGFFYSGGWYKVGSYGRYWSSTQYDSSYGYNLRFNSSSLYTDSNDKYVGESVRCIMEPPTMQNTACSSLPEGQTSTLPDARDNQDYTIYRFPTTGTAGTNYPTGMAGYCLMTKDLSLGYVTGGSITKGANLTLTTDSSASSGTITARTGTSDWSTTNSDGNLQYINGPQSGQEAYSSHSYYSYGAAQKVCPKGWRLPTKAEYDNIRTFMGGDNSTGSSTIRTNPYNFVYGGFFYSGGWYVVGSEGVYWSSTQYENNNQNGYNLYLAPSRLYTDGVDNMNRGKSVRCVTN